MKKFIAATLCLVALFSVPLVAWELPQADLVPEPRKLVALTFDDGPTDVTIKILNDLAKHNAQATFFVLGDRLERFPETTRRIVDEGHQIGNHSFSHKQLNRISVNELNAELDKANEAIFKATGIKPTIMRAPYGEHNTKVLEAAQARGMAVIKWSIDSIDWANGTPVSSITQRALKNVQSGDIILMHDLYAQSGKAASIIIQELVERGFELVTVDELIAHYSAGLEPGAVYVSGIKKFSIADGMNPDIWSEGNR